MTAKEAFHQLKKAVMSAPVLAYPDPDREYLLEMDTSKLGLGAVLSQKQTDGKYHPVALEVEPSMELSRTIIVPNWSSWP